MLFPNNSDPTFQYEESGSWVQTLQPKSFSNNKKYKKSLNTVSLQFKLFHYSCNFADGKLYFFNHLRKFNKT